MQKLICITGMDGTGKSTLVKKLSQVYPSVSVSAIWDIFDGGVDTIPFRSKKDIDSYLCELTPGSRLLFLAHALKFSLDKAKSHGKELILLNGYHYKYIASELALGVDKELAKYVVNMFPVPDKVIRLTLPVKEAAERKGSFSRYESGLASNPSPHEFIDFQEKILQHWPFFDQTNWVSLDTLKEHVEIFDKAIQLIH